MSVTEAAVLDDVPADVLRALKDPQRLGALRHRLALLEPASDAPLDWLTRLASSILHAPVAFVSLVGEDRQFVRSSVGLPDPWATTGEMPLSHSFCQHVVAVSEPFVVEDSREHPLLKDSIATRLCVITYAGVPLITSDGQAIGSFCVIGSRPRVWTNTEIEILQDLAGSALAEIELRVAVQQAQQKADEAGRERTEKLAILESITDGFFALDREWRFTYLNWRAEQTFERPRADLIGRNIWEVYPDGVGTNLFEEYHQAILENSTLHVEKFYRPTGTWMEIHAYPSKDGLSVYFRDVTERRQAEQALRESEERYRRFFEEDLSGAFISTPSGRLVGCNPAFARIFGFDTPDEAMRADLRSLYASPEARAEMLDRVRRERRIENLELELRSRDGQPVHVIENVTGVFNDAGELVQLKGYLVDISERRQLEDQLRQSQKMEAIGRMAGGIAHDFNNMLTAIKGYSDFLLQDLDPRDPRRMDVEEVRKAAERATALTRQLLAFSRRQMLQPRVLDLNTVVSDTEKMLRRLIGADLELVTQLDAELGRVKADPGQIEQVLMNLVVNARDAMPQGGRITITTGNAMLGESYTQMAGAGDSPFVLVAVGDTGHGMDKDTQTRIFEPFFTTKEVGKGTGLGLSTVYGIVKQSGGHIVVYSEVGQGTTFKIYLPRVDEDAEAFATITERQIPQGSETILVVEDEEPVRMLCHKVLTRGGYSVLQAPNGNAALEVAARHQGPIHLLLTDMVMPEMGGRELADRLMPDRPEMRVLFTSGYTEDMILRRGEPQQGTAFLEKPFTPDVLAHKVRETLDGSPAEAPA